MQLVKVSLFELNIGLTRDNSEMLELCTALENKRVESETRRLAAESSLRAEQQKSAQLRAIIVAFCFAGLLWAVFPTIRVFIAVGGLCFVVGGLLLVEAHRLTQYASEALKRAISLWQSAREKMRSARVAVLAHAQQMRGRIRDWKWKPIPFAKIFGTTP